METLLSKQVSILQTIVQGHTSLQPLKAWHQKHGSYYQSYKLSNTLKKRL